MQILFGLDVTIEQGEIVALLGTNGAGKSTLFKVITGLLPAQRGTVRFNGQDITNRSTTEIVEAGMVMMPGGRSVFPTLSVRENLRLAGWLKRKDKAAVAADEERVLSLFPRLRERYDQLAGDLSGGEQQMLAISQALMPDPTLLLIDELSLGLAPTVVGQLIDVVHQTHESGITIVVVEQSINVALRLAERAVFMEKGEFRFTGPTRELLERPDILRSVFIGESKGGTESTVRTPPAEDAPVVLEVRQVAKRFGGITAVNDVDLELREGEIVGLIGQNGAGKTTLFDCISGFLEVDGGRVLLRDEDIADLPPHERALRGLGRSFQEARLFPSLTTAETIAIARERHILNRWLHRRRLQPTGVPDLGARHPGEGRPAHRPHGARCLPGQARRRAVDRHPTHRRAGVPAGGRPHGHRPRRAVRRRGPAGDGGARAAPAARAGLHRHVDPRHRARHAAAVDHLRPHVRARARRRHRRGHAGGGARAPPGRSSPTWAPTSPPSTAPARRRSQAQERRQLVVVGADEVRFRRVRPVVVEAASSGPKGGRGRVRPRRRCGGGRRRERRGRVR